MSIYMEVSFLTESVYFLVKNGHGRISVGEFSRYLYDFVHPVFFPRKRSMSFWNGWWDEEEEGRFAKVTDGSSKLGDNNFHPWYPSEPNGRRLENCAVSWTLKDGRWNDENCDFKVK